MTGISGDNLAFFFGENKSAGVFGGRAFNASSNKWRFRHDARSRLLLHVRAHQSAVRVIVLEKWDHRGGNRKSLISGNVYIVDILAVNNMRIAFKADLDFRRNDIAFSVHGNSRVSNVVLL